MIVARRPGGGGGVAGSANCAKDGDAEGAGGARGGDGLTSGRRRVGVALARTTVTDADGRARIELSAGFEGAPRCWRRVGAGLPTGQAGWWANSKSHAAATTAARRRRRLG